MAQPYAVTIKQIQQGYTPTKVETYQTLLELLRTHKGIEVESQFELDSKGRIHLHGIFNARRNLKVDRFKKQYWHIHIQSLETQQDLDNWLKYIRKDLTKSHTVNLDN